MVKKNLDKVFELKIQDDDEISGIDSISLVDEPAIEVNWVSFKKQQEEFYIPDGEDEKYLKFFDQKGESEADLLADGWEVVKEEFVTATPNEHSQMDTEQYQIRYKYILNPQASGAPIKATTRAFCKDLINKNYVYRIEDLDAMTNDLGSSALVWRGSYNCRHLWQQITYKKDVTIGIKSSDRKGRVDGKESIDILGYQQPDTRVPGKPSFAKEGFAEKPKVSVDYDGVLSTSDGEDLVQELIAEGNDVYVVTARNEMEGEPILAKAKEYRIPAKNVVFTNGKSKAPILKALGISKHYDNNPDVLADIKKNAPGVEGIQFDYDVSTIGGYVDPGLKKKPIPKAIATSKEFLEEFNQLDFASHSDYPQEVKDVAKRVLKWVEENGWGSCGTAVGKQRANQLANGEAISESTIHRMYSYLSRHKVDLQSSKSYEDGCGKLMYDSWGGAPALQWAERKINILNAHRMQKQHFASDEEQHIVLGPAMIPNEHIFRKDANGNPYYVFFSPDTIKMIADKYMKNKYTDNNDLMHDGKAVPDVYVTQSWIKESQNDKSTDYGFGSLPVGTWFVSMKVNNPDVWSQVKEGKLNGFSVSGYFEEVAQFTKEEMFLYKVAELLKNVKE
jgi:hypothetical protein